ncbi:MAG: anthranilate synthase component I family protein [Bacillus sp. (in: firmicutes)]
MKKVYSRCITSSLEVFYQAYTELSANETHHVLLESGRDGKYSIWGISPEAVLEGSSDRLVITDRSGGREVLTGNPLQSMKAWMKERHMAKQPGLPEFQGGAIGFISYDYARQIEKLPSLAVDDLQIPDISFLVFHEMAVYDHETSSVYFLKISDDQQSSLVWLANMEEQYRRAGAPGKQKDIPRYEETDRSTGVSMTEEEFVYAVHKIKEYISQGDLFQVNLSVRQSEELFAPPQAVYSVLRRLNPSPYMAYLSMPGLQIVSSSPELLVEKKGKKVSTRPIAGTRSRGGTAVEDERLAGELLNNEKERAEHVMLVDLERNDLGKVCEYGSVRVSELMTIERYSHVMHLVSHVEGTIGNEHDAFSVIDAVFPGGTITGAPKIRTMEVIEELEPYRRGIYTGSIGWIGFDGDMEMNIVIRTLVAKEGKAYIQAGAGIVIDSVPEYEYKESLKKAKAVWKAKRLADDIYLEGGKDQ